MARVVQARIVWDTGRANGAVPGYRGFHDLLVGPEPAYPFGRKGLALLSGWKQLADPGTDGMLLLDGDVVIDPFDLDMMNGAIHELPGVVHTAPVRVWPVSTKFGDWTWGHWRDGPSQEIDLTPRWFSFCFTYLPRALITGCEKAGLAKWAYPRVDSAVSKNAQQLGIAVNVVTEATPKHLNF